MSFLLAAPLLHFHCVWPEFTVFVISGTRHTVFTQLKDDNLHYEVSLSN